MSQTAFGQTSQFKDTTARGVVSGMGLLTFWQWGDLKIIHIKN